MSQLDSLLGQLVGAPALPGARCRGRHHLFDVAEHGEAASTVLARHTQALGLCEHCPALDRCQSWLESLPDAQRPHGVVAGRRVHPYTRTPTL